MAATPEQNARRRELYKRDSDTERGRAARAVSREYHQRNREAVRIYKRGYYLRNRDKALASFLFNRHGLRPEDWAAFWASQDGRCYLCGEPMAKGGKTGAHVDHDHSHCGDWASCKVCQRGLACMDCNMAIGHAHDDPARLRRMADALEAAQAEVERRKEGAPHQAALFETDKGD